MEACSCETPFYGTCCAVRCALCGVAEKCAIRCAGLQSRGPRCCVAHVQGDMLKATGAAGRNSGGLTGHDRGRFAVPRGVREVCLPASGLCGLAEQGCSAAGGFDLYRRAHVDRKFTSGLRSIHSQKPAFRCTRTLAFESLFEPYLERHRQCGPNCVAQAELPCAS